MFFGGPKIKQVLFDVGGVFVDAELDRYIQIGCAMFQTTPEALKQEMTEHLPALETGSIDSVTFWKELGESLWRAGKGKISYDNNFEGLWGNMLMATLSIDNRMLKVVELLKQNGYKVGIVSNVIAEHAAVLERVNFYSQFEPCVLSCNIGVRKPQPDIYRMAVKMSGVSLRSCLFIDDSPVNVQAAQELGMNGLVFSSIEQLCEDLTSLRLLR